MREYNNSTFKGKSILLRWFSFCPVCIETVLLLARGEFMLQRKWIGNKNMIAFKVFWGYIYVVSMFVSKMFKV